MPLVPPGRRPGFKAKGGGGGTACTGDMQTTHVH